MRGGGSSATTASNAGSGNSSSSSNSGNSSNNSSSNSSTSSNSSSSSSASSSSSTQQKASSTSTKKLPTCEEWWKTINEKVCGENGLFAWGLTSAYVKIGSKCMGMEGQGYKQQDGTKCNGLGNGELLVQRKADNVSYSIKGSFYFGLGTCICNLDKPLLYSGNVNGLPGSGILSLMFIEPFQPISSEEICAHKCLEKFSSNTYLKNKCLLILSNDEEYGKYCRDESE